MSATQLLWQLPARAAERAPTHPAVVLDADVLSYAELHATACRIAGALDALGVRPHDRVALLAAKSPVLAAAVYGILRAGAAYVPLDPSAPAARHATIARDAAVRCVIAEPALLAACLAAEPMTALAPDQRPRALVIGDATPPACEGVPSARTADLGQFPAERAAVRGADVDLAYILYTSGSTGVPKGVMHSHASALAFASWAAEEFGVRAEDRVSNHAPLHFDLSTFDYFSTAAAGATVYPVPAREAIFPASVAQRMERDRHTVAYATPSTWMQMMTRGRLAERDLSALRVALYAGEVFPAPALRRFLAFLPRAARCWNLYGPTETNVCTFARVTEAPADGAPSSIGRACPYDDAFAMREDGRVASPGEEGELLVGGRSVMLGYWGDAERTVRLLVPDPREADGGCVYRTGDVVRAEADGSFLYLGRRDHQVKVRGFRVELEEIESALLAVDGVAEAVAVSAPHAEQGAVIGAAVVPLGGRALDARALRASLAARLPPYMVPERIDVRASLPRTSSGKTDRQRAAEDWTRNGGHAADGPRTADS